MKYKKTSTTIAFLLLGLVGLHAQTSLNATGGEASGTGGTSCYSLGQIVYTTATGPNGSVAQGVQQAYEISTTVGTNKNTIRLEMSVYPNPTIAYLTLEVEDFENTSYKLYDIQGKIIEGNKVSSSITSVGMVNLPIATYFLTVFNENLEVKNFKIIKN